MLVVVSDNVVSQELSQGTAASLHTQSDAVGILLLTVGILCFFKVMEKHWPLVKLSRNIQESRPDRNGKKSDK